jgi:hypothetical protein
MRELDMPTTARLPASPRPCKRAPQTRPPPTIMSKGSKYLLVSLPTSISPSSHPDEALTALRSTITTDCGTTYPFSIPTFKIGTLDALVQQADDLAKLESACEGVVNKVGDSLKTILDGDEGKAQQNKTINDSTHTASNSRMVIPGETDSVGRARRPVPADFSVEQDQIPGR